MSAYESIELQKSYHILKHFYRNRLKVQYSLYDPTCECSNQEKTSERDNHLFALSYLFLLYFHKMHVSSVFHFYFFISFDQFLSKKWIIVIHRSFIIFTINSEKLRNSNIKVRRSTDRMILNHFYIIHLPFW